MAVNILVIPKHEFFGCRIQLGIVPSRLIGFQPALQNHARAAANHIGDGFIGHFIEAVLTQHKIHCGVKIGLGIGQRAVQIKQKGSHKSLFSLGL